MSARFPGAQELTISERGRPLLGYLGTETEREYGKQHVLPGRQRSQPQNRTCRCSSAGPSRQRTCPSTSEFLRSLLPASHLQRSTARPCNRHICWTALRSQ